MCRCGGGGEHEHAVDLDAKSLFQYVDFKYSSVLNGCKPMVELERIIRSKFTVDKEACLESDTDVQLLVKIQ
jgi:hypothetical protein